MSKIDEMADWLFGWPIWVLGLILFFVMLSVMSDLKKRGIEAKRKKRLDRKEG